MGNSERVAVENLTRDAECAVHGTYVQQGMDMRLPSGRVMWFKCPACARAETEADAVRRAQVEAKEAQARHEASLRRAGIPMRFRSRTLATFTATTTGQTEALAKAREFVEQWPSHREAGTTMVFSGRPGTGKSHLAIAIAQEVIAMGSSAFYVTARELILMLREGWKNDEAQSELQVLNRLTAIDLLVVDEVGVAFGSEAERVQFFGVVDGRYREQRPTILLTNLDKRGLAEFVGQRAFDRLREGGIWVPFDWDSYRGQGPYP